MEPSFLFKDRRETHPAVPPLVSPFVKSAITYKILFVDFEKSFDRVNWIDIQVNREGDIAG